MDKHLVYFTLQQTAPIIVMAQRHHYQVSLHYQVKPTIACYKILGKVLCCDSLMTKEANNSPLT